MTCSHSIGAKIYLFITKLHARRNLASISYRTVKFLVIIIILRGRSLQSFTWGCRKVLLYLFFQLHEDEVISVAQHTQDILLIYFIAVKEFRILFSLPCGDRWAWSYRYKRLSTISTTCLYMKWTYNWDNIQNVLERCFSPYKYGKYFSNDKGITYTKLNL